MHCLGRKTYNLQGDTWYIAFKLLIIFYGDTVSILLDFWIRLFNAWSYTQLPYEINFRNILKDKENGNFALSVWVPEKAL